MDFDSLYICPQKMGHALTAGPAVDRWDWKCILGNVVWFSKLPDIPKLTDRKGFHSLDRKYGLTLCVITVQSRIQPFENGPVTSSSLGLSHMMKRRTQMISILDDMTTLIGLEKIRTGRSERKFPGLGRRARNTVHI